MAKKEPLRVLHIVSGMNRGGAETLLMNLYRNVDRGNIQFDFVVHSGGTGHYDDEITSLGGRIFRVKSLGQQGPVKYIINLRRIFNTEGPFWAIHSHTDFQGGIVMLAAKLAGIKRRVCHSHSTDWHLGHGFLNNILLKGLKFLIHYNSTVFCSCSEDAARFLFGDSVQDRAIVLPNAIELDPFEDVYKRNKRELKKKFGIPEDILLLGHVGRFDKAKNHLFLIRFAEYLMLANVRFLLLLVGDGPLRNEIDSLVREKGLNEQVKLLGVRTDISELMRAFDVFVFPSLYEGLGIVIIEAQAAGTPCIISDTIPNEADIGLGLIKRLGLNDSMSKWAATVTEAPKQSGLNWTDVKGALSSKGYDIKDCVQQLMKMYKL